MVQSRERIIDINSDNAGFATYMSIIKNELLEKILDLRNNLMIPDNKTIAIYGEWAGQGIQKNVAISELEKSFFVFSIKIVDLEDETKNYYIEPENKYLRSFKIPDLKIYNIFDYGIYEIEIDFNNPELSQNKIIELTTKVADECPVANSFGFKGIGEGIVFSFIYKNELYFFKSKDERHSSSKVKTLKKVDDEKINKLIDISNKVCPSWRLEQMVEKTYDLMNGGSLTPTKISELIKNVKDDILKEEKDVLIKENIDIQDLMKYVSKITRDFYFEYEKNNILK